MTYRRSSSIALVLCVIGVNLLAQAPVGSLTGIVADPDGAPVPTASVEAKNAATGMVYKGRSGRDGSYTISKLPAGTYDVTVPPIGFTFPKFERKGVMVAAGQPVRLDIRLVWGGNLGTPGDDVSIGIRSKGSPEGRAPRTRDGKPDFSGVWLGNAADAEQPAMLPWAEAITRERRATRFAGNPSTACLPGDIFLVSPFLYKVIQTPAVMAILWEGNPPGVLQIFLDDRRHPKDPFPTWMGHSVGRWEGDTLVVDTVGFNDLGWAWLYPHTEKLHAVQRYRRPNLGHLEKEVTIEDPGAFTKPWKIRDTWDLAPTEEVQEYVCNENEKDAVHVPGR